MDTHAGGGIKAEEESYEVKLWEAKRKNYRFVR